MTDLRKAAEMALEALENHSGNYKLSKTECVHHNAAVEALRQALAQQALADSIRPKGKSITKVWVDEIHQALNVNAIDTSATCVDENKKSEHKPWVSLTDEERSDVIGDIFGNIFAAPQKSLSLARAIEAKLKEKNT